MWGVVNIASTQQITTHLCRFKVGREHDAGRHQWERQLHLVRLHVTESTILSTPSDHQCLSVPDKCSLLLAMQAEHYVWSRRSWAHAWAYANSWAYRRLAGLKAGQLEGRHRFWHWLRLAEALVLQVRLMGRMPWNSDRMLMLNRPRAGETTAANVRAWRPGRVMRQCHCMRPAAAASPAAAAEAAAGAGTLAAHTA